MNAEKQLSDDAHADELLCTLLRDEVTLWPDGIGLAFEARILSRAEYHGVAVLLNERSRQMANWPQPLRNALRDRAHAHAFWELRHGRLMGEVIEAFAKRGIEPLFFKGTALAYSVYDNPVFRTRGDTDILVAPERFMEAGEALRRLGYSRTIALAGEFVAHQEVYTLHLENGDWHVIDLHRRINNSPFLARLFEFEELHAQSVSLPRLHPKARAVSPTQALSIACLHRLKHHNSPYYIGDVAHYGKDRLVWLYDIHLLARSCSDTQWSELVRMTREKGLCFSTRDGLARAHEFFDSTIAEGVMAALRQDGEPVQRYFQAGLLRQVQIDFLALDELGTRLTFAREIVFPNTIHIQSRYGFANRAWLPLYYARRAAAVLARRLKAQCVGAK